MKYSPSTELLLNTFLGASWSIFLATGFLGGVYVTAGIGQVAFGMAHPSTRKSPWPRIVVFSGGVAGASMNYAFDWPYSGMLFAAEVGAVTLALVLVMCYQWAEERLARGSQKQKKRRIT